MVSARGRSYLQGCSHGVSGLHPKRISVALQTARIAVRRAGWEAEGLGGAQDRPWGCAAELHCDFRQRVQCQHAGPALGQATI